MMAAVALILVLTACVFYLVHLWTNVYLKPHIVRGVTIGMVVFWCFEAGVLMRLLGG